MSDTVIKVENLSKSYQIRHQASRPAGTRSAGERYTALRDVLTNGVKHMGNRLLGRTASRPRGTRSATDASREEFWALNDVSFEVKQGAPQGHPVGIPSPALRAGPSPALRTSPSPALRTSPSPALRTSPSPALRAGIGRNGAGKSTLTSTSVRLPFDRLTDPETSA